MVNDTNIYEEISSSDEEPILNGQFNELLLELEKDLEKIKNDSDEELSEYFEELETLKKIATLPVINIKNVTEFLETAIFILMVELPEGFSFEPLTIYKCMLKKVESFPEKFYKEHLQILLNLKNEETKDLLLSIKKEREEKQTKNLLLEKNEQQISVIRPFFSILSKEKAQKRANSTDAETVCKRKKLRKISPLALPKNNFINPIDDGCQEDLVQSVIKLS